MAQGAVEERLEDALSEMLRNCLDPNLKAGARVVTLEISLTPNDDRSSADIAIKCKTKGQPPFGISTRAFIGMGADGKPEAFEVRRTQLQVPFATNQTDGVGFSVPALVRGGVK